MPDNILKRSLPLMVLSAALTAFSMSPVLAQGADDPTNKSASAAPTTGNVGPDAAPRLEVVFGQSLPLLVCKVNLTCLVELEDGELSEALERLRRAMT